MPISDNNPERRNLVVTSSIFIIYYLGGGEIEGPISLPIISLRFENTVTLIVIAWLSLFWFFIRYHQIHSKLIWTKIGEEINSERGNKILTRYLSKILKKPYADENGFRITSISVSQGNLEVQTESISGGKRGEDGMWVEYKMTAGDRVNITWAYRGLLRLVLMLSQAINQPAIGSYFVPYLLFIFACVLGVLGYLNFSLFEIIERLIDIYVAQI